MARPILLKRPSPFSFPGGSPGIDTTNPAAANLLFSAVPANGNFIDIANGARLGTIVGSPTARNYGSMGPGVAFLGSTDAITFSFPTTAFTIGTTAAIFEVNVLNGTAGSAANLIGGDTSSGSVGFGMDYFGTSFSARVGGSFSNMLPLNSIVPLGVPFFVVMTARPLAAPTGVAVNLQTGQTWVITGNGTVGTSFTGTGIMRLGNRDDTTRQLNGVLSAFMRSNTFLTIPQMLQWAQDPWSFWYPAKIDMWHFLSKVTASGAVINKTVTATCTSTAVLTRTIGKTLASTCTSTSTLIRRVSKTLAATLTSTSSLVAIKAKLLTLTATCTSTASLVTHSTFARSLLATCTSTSVMIKNVGKTLAATCTSTSALIRRIGKTLTVTCTSTASSFVHKCVTFTQALNAVCTTTSAVNVLKGLAGSVASLASKLRPYEPQNTPVIPGSEALYLANELQKVRNAFAAHIQATKDLDARLKAAGF